jgi:hypothetical protein
MIPIVATINAYFVTVKLDCLPPKQKKNFKKTFEKKFFFRQCTSAGNNNSSLHRFLSTCMIFRKTKKRLVIISHQQSVIGKKVFDNNCPVFAFITNSHQSKSLSQLRENFFQYITSKVCLKVSGDHALVSVSTQLKMDN